VCIRLPAEDVPGEAFTQCHGIFPAVDSNLHERLSSHPYSVF
jgi:hypothetical protein